MKFFPQQIADVRLVEDQPVSDERGYFARIYCAAELDREGIVFPVSQSSLAFSRRAHTLRGLHYQDSSHAEQKLVRCVRGEAYVVVLDLRPNSSSFHQWIAVTLSPGSGGSLYVPAGCAQGYQTLLDDTELLYSMDKPYHPEAARGVRFDDPVIGVEWPAPPAVISDRDLAWPNLDAGARL